MPEALPFSKHVPIVGQGVRIIGYTVLPLVMCDCGHLEPLQLMAQVAHGQVGASILSCPQCQTSYQIIGVTCDTKGQLSFNLDQKKPGSA